MSVDRILFQWPLLSSQGELVIAANAQPDAEEWEAMLEIAQAYKAALERRKAKGATKVQPAVEETTTAPEKDAGTADREG